MRITRIVGHEALSTKVSYDKFFATKEYIYQKLFENLFSHGINMFIDAKLK